VPQFGQVITASNTITGVSISPVTEMSAGHVAARTLASRWLEMVGVWEGGLGDKHVSGRTVRRSPCNDRGE
ncbi:MAG: hypothetical protein ABSE77_18150, partial [Acidimicrobiales bacterium]